MNTGLVLLASAAVGLSVFALIQSRTASPSSASPGWTPSAAASASDLPSSAPPVSTPPVTPTSTPALSPLQQMSATLGRPGAQVMVIGDGSGNETDEWVALWARNHLATSRAVSLSTWNRTSADYDAAVSLGQGEALTVWNASTRSPEMAEEPQRVAQAWREADVVLLSYGHRRTAGTIAGQLDQILAAIRGQDAQVPVAVVLQNPDPTASAAQQSATVEAVNQWAARQGLPTIDVYAGFPSSQAERNRLVEEDGSPNPEGSALFARIVAEALPVS